MSNIEVFETHSMQEPSIITGITIDIPDEIKNTNYVKLFKNHAEYEQYISGEAVELPIVSHCIQEVESHYNPY